MNSRKRLKRLTIGDYIIPAILILFALLIFLPVWYVFVVALIPPHVFFQQTIHLWPSELFFENFGAILGNPLIHSGFRNTLFVTVISTAYAMFMNVTFAYVMMKPLPGRRIFWLFLMFTMFFGGGLLPWFLMMVNLGLVNSLWAMILPHGVSIFSVILMQSYFRTLSPEYEESAKLDGAGDLRILWSIVLPLCKPMLATLSLFAAVGGWNRWLEAMLLTHRSALWPLQLVLRNMLNNAALTMEGVPLDAREGLFTVGLQMAAVIVTMIPIICVYPFLQKYFVKGITLGGVKG